MLDELPQPALREASPCILETERLTLRRPTLADVRAIAHLANDRRIAEHARYLPHPYSQDHAIAFVRTMAVERSEIAFLIERDSEPVGMAGINWRDRHNAELGFWLGVEHWGRGFGTEAARAVIDYFFETFDYDRLSAGARVANPRSRKVLEKCGFKWSGVELHRFEALRSSSPVDRFRLWRSGWLSLRTGRVRSRDQGADLTPAD